MMKIDKRLLEPEKKPYKPPTEREELEAAGCSNNEEWHSYLSSQMWKECTPDIKNGCYIGTHEANIQRCRREKKIMEF